MPNLPDRLFKKKDVKYMGLTYNPRWKPACNKGVHLFDEVLSVKEHYLYCDACGLVVHIKDMKRGAGENEKVESNG